MNWRSFYRDVYISCAVIFNITIIILIMHYMKYNSNQQYHDMQNYIVYNDNNNEQFTNISNKEKSKDITIISYSDSNYYSALRNLVGSVHFWEPNLQIVVFNLGMSKEQLEDIRKWRNTKLEDFDFSLYPDYVRDLHKYAFKPILLNKTFHEYGFIFIEDAGQEFRQPITKVKEWIKRDGFFANGFGMNPAGDLKYTHPGTMKYLNLTLQRGHCQGGIVGMFRDHPKKKQNLTDFLEEYATCAKIENCISPEGATLGNHRFDQAVQTLLTQKYYLDCNGGNEIGCFVEGQTSHPPLTSDPTKTNDIIVCSRRANEPKPYAKYLQYN